jgi:hypothetical protein
MESLPEFATRKSVREKVSNYLFNPRNPAGWAKGQWFKRALGFEPLNREHHKLLELQLIFDPRTAVWQRDPTSSIIRLLTVMPPR